jgi:hypothetical protein
MLKETPLIFWSIRADGIHWIELLDAQFLIVGTKNKAAGSGAWPAIRAHSHYE